MVRGELINRCSPVVLPWIQRAGVHSSYDSSATLVFVFGVGIIFHFHPSTVQPKRSFGETGLNLSEKAPRGEADHPPKN